LAKKHPAVKGGRNIGLFGIVELQKNSAGEPFAGYNASSPVVSAFHRALTESGVFTLVRGSAFMCNPPLTITEGEIRATFATISKVLKIADDAFEG
jgi:taurine--2-oxoglutarate transaminase